MEELIKNRKIERKFIEIAEEKRKCLRLSKGEFAALKVGSDKIESI